MEHYGLDESVSGRQCGGSHHEHAALNTTLDQVSGFPNVLKLLEPDKSPQRKRRRDSIEAAEASKAWNEERSFRRAEPRLAPSFDQTIQQKLQRFEQVWEKKADEMIERKLEQKFIERLERPSDEGIQRGSRHGEDFGLELRLESMIEAVLKKWQLKKESTSTQRSSASYVHLLESSEVGTLHPEAETDGQRIEVSSLLDTAVRDGIDRHIEPKNHTVKKIFDCGFGSCFSKVPQSQYSHILSCISSS